jgi:tetratricopeptide (TPR) repeat protein
MGGGWESSAVTRAPDRDLPPGRGFVGRRLELAELMSGLHAAFAGHGTLYAVVGEPGIGKSRLASEFASLAHERGARVLWASALREPRAVAPPYWLWTTLLRDAARAGAPWNAGNSTTADTTPAGAGGVEAHEVLAGAARDLQLVGEPIVPTLGLFDATLERLVALARTQPLVIVLDHLCAADRLSLLALEFIAFHLSRIPMVIGAIYREAEMSQMELGTGLPHSHVFHDSRMLPLHALSRVELTQMIEERTGRTADDTGVECVMELTRGNPLFVELLLRESGFPSAVEDELDAHLAPAIVAAAKEHLVVLSESAREMLAAAAVIGKDFDLAALRALADCAPAAMLDGLAEAQAAGVLELRDGASGSYRFVHLLVWRALYDSLPGSRRALLHHEAGRFIERAFGYDRSRLEELARHFHEGILIGGADKAVDYCRRAGDHAMKSSRFKMAARLYVMAVAAANLGAPDEPRRCDLLLQAAEAHAAAGDLTEAAGTFWLAAELAEARGDAGRFAQAALGRAGFSTFAPAEPDLETVALLTRALGVLEKRDAALRVRLLLRLAAELRWQEDAQARRREMEQEAELIARRTGNPEAEFAVLVHRHLFVHCAPESIDEQLAGTTEMLNVALGAGRAEDCVTALVCRYGSMLRKGEVVLPPPGLALVPADEPDLEGRVLQRGYRYYAAIRALLEGRFKEGASLVMRFLSPGHAVGRVKNIDIVWPALVLPFRELGRLAEVEALAAASIEQRPWVPLLQALAMKIHWLLAKREQAREEFERLAARDFQDLPRDVGFLVCLSSLAEVCAGLKDRRRAALLYRLLEPHETMNAVFGPLVFFGPVSFYLGVLSDVMGDFERAQGHFEAALGACGRLKARAWEAYVRHGWAQMLDRRGDAASCEKARELADDALVTAEELKMADLAGRLAELGEAAADRLGASTGYEPHGAETARSAPAVQDRLKRGFTAGYGDGAPEKETIAQQSCDANANERRQRPPANPALASGNGRVLAREGDSRSQEDDRAVSGSPSRPAPCKEEATLAHAPPDSAAAVFRREGEYWTLRYEGRLARVGHRKGLAVIAHLLGHAGREFHALELCSLLDQDGGEMPGRSVRGCSQYAEEPILDTRAKQSYRHRLRELRQELEEAKVNNDPLRADRLEEEAAYLTRELARAFGIYGRSRRIPSDVERARVRVTSVIRSAIDHIGKHHRALGRFLATSIRTGAYAAYTSPTEPGPDWQL